MGRVSLEKRQKAYKKAEEMQDEGVAKQEIVEALYENRSIPKSTAYQWLSGESKPRFPTGKITFCEDLFYVLGALLGDGCIYNPKTNRYHAILVGSKNFTSKYANRLDKCSNKKVKPYIDRNKNIWVARVNNYELYSLLQKARNNNNYLRELITDSSNQAKLLFVEGFFDAEGCVKVIKGKNRKTPKICLDITNTNKDILDLIKDLLQETLEIESRYSMQEAYTDDRGVKRKASYHLRVYKKSFVRAFFNNVNTIKLTEEKSRYKDQWLNYN